MENRISEFGKHLEVITSFLSAANSVQARSISFVTRCSSSSNVFMLVYFKKELVNGGGYSFVGVAFLSETVK